MKRADKLEVIEGLVEKFSTFGCFYMIDAMGLTVDQINKFRQRCAQRNIVYQVAKNTFIRKALERVAEGDAYADFSSRVLKGFTGILFTYESGHVPAKMLKDFFVAEKLSMPLFKGASVDGEVFIGATYLEALSNLKSKNEILSDMIALLRAPITRVMASLQLGGARLVGVVETLSHSGGAATSSQ